MSQMVDVIDGQVLDILVHTLEADTILDGDVDHATLAPIEAPRVHGSPDRLSTEGLSVLGMLVPLAVPPVAIVGLPLVLAASLWIIRVSGAPFKLRCGVLVLVWSVSGSVVASEHNDMIKLVVVAVRASEHTRRVLEEGLAIGLEGNREWAEGKLFQDGVWVRAVAIAVKESVFGDCEIDVWSRERARLLRARVWVVLVVLDTVVSGVVPRNSWPAT